MDEIQVLYALWQQTVCCTHQGKLLTYLDAMCVASAEQYRPFADDCSKIIASINAAIKNRSKKEAKPKETKNEETKK